MPPDLGVRDWIPKNRELPAVLVDERGGPAHETDLRIAIEIGELLLQPTRQGDVVGVEPCDQWRASAGDAAVQRPGEARAFLALQEHATVPAA